MTLGEGQGVAGHRPRDLGGGGVELVLEGLQRDGHDGDVEDGHDRAEHDDAGDDEDALVELVGWLGGVGADLALGLGRTGSHREILRSKAGSARPTFVGGWL